MKKSRSKHASPAFVLCAAMLCAGNAFASEQTKSEAGIEKAVTHCLGRFVLDLPSDAEYVGRSYEYGFSTVEMQRMSYEEFLKDLNAFETKLRSTKHKSGSTLLLKTNSPDDKNRVLSFWERSGADVLVRTSGYRWIDGMRYLLKMTSDPDKMERANVHATNVLAHLNSRSNEIPTSPGFCIAHGIITDEGSSKDESLNARFRLKNRPDIVIDIATTRNTDDPPESLLSRKPGVLSALGILGATLGGVRNIREGDRVVSGMPGQEWLLKAPNDQGHQAHLFTWEAPGLQRDSLHPQVRIDLQSGNNDGGFDPSPASLTDAQMLELWERILPTLRLRPIDDSRGVPGKQPSPQTNNGNALPLDELVRTGGL